MAGGFELLLYIITKNPKKPEKNKHILLQVNDIKKLNKYTISYSFYRERERERERERHTHTHTHREREREKKREGKRE